MLKTGYEDYPQYKAILGIDEVGYGCGAGDLYVSGVILPMDFSNKDFKDSKKITSEKKRGEIAELIHNNTDIIKHTVSLDVKHINEIGISKCLSILFTSIAEKLSGSYDAIFIDGIDTRGLGDFGVDLITVIKGDNTYQNIAAASIIAKVSRDNYMREMAVKYPGYDFENNKGYLTPKHIKGLKEHGKKEIHREKYVKNFIG